MHKLLFYILILILLYIFTNNKSENYQNWLDKQKKLLVL